MASCRPDFGSVDYIFILFDADDDGLRNVKVQSLKSQLKREFKSLNTDKERWKL